MTASRSSAEVIASKPARTSGEACRAVTSEEIAHYRACGWVKLEGFVGPHLVAQLLDTARAMMGPDGDGNAPSSMPQDFFNPEMTHGLTSPLFGPLIRQVGVNAKVLIGRREGIEVRYFGDFFLPKLPAAKPSRHAGNGRTYFHQDYINWALDRSGGMTIWIALTDLAPESGTMSFVSGSHRMGTLGNYRTFEKEDVLEQYPELLEACTIDGPISYRAGDATVHSNLCVHGAGENLTNAPRWAYAIIVNPSDVRWNGGPAEAFDTTGMQVLQELDDQRFPIIS
jgi:hypothetical protein